MAKRTIGPFELGDKLGVGGMGVVYRAIYTKTGIACAIKVLAPEVSDSPQVQQRFEREIAILKKLQHPHIVRYFGGGKVGNQRFYAMELVQGGSLEGYLKERKKVPWEEALRYIRQVAEALEHAHTAGVIHRDLKPANLLLGPNGVLKLTDFGIARDTTATALTAAGKTVGTYAYMAPEQIRGKPPVDRRTDLYSLGCVLFEMLTGETPFDSDNAGDLLVKHLQDDPPRVTSFTPDCPIWLEEMVFRLMEKEPDERYFDALALQVAIDEINEKISRQASLVGTAMGDASTKSVGAGGVTQLKDGTVKKKKKKKKDQSPFYEQIWFLATGLVLIAGIVIWSLMPPSEAKLFAAAEALMQTNDVYKMRDAREKYLLPLLKRFPKGEHAAQAQEYLDQVDMQRIEDQAKNRKGKPKTEGEKFYLQAERFQKYGDRVKALEVFQNMTILLQDLELDKDGDAEKHRENQLWMRMAQKKVDEIKAEGGEMLDSEQVVRNKLREADEHVDNKRRIDAMKIWDSVIELYQDNDELAPYVEEAREKRKLKPKPVETSP
ncbi:MAG: serine/threonine-protein kinase [Planctomycetaceae bacterium]|nr:serine/threonine-protein kinase [Planctomycetaceae bacterium]